MKKQFYKLIAFIALSIFSTSMYAQVWSACGTGMDQTVYALCADTINNVVYAGGAFIQADGKVVNHIAKWDGTTWSVMGMLMGTNYTMIGTDDTVMALCMYQGKLYAGGHFMNAEGALAEHIAVWNGSGWSPVDSIMNGDVHALAVYNGQLYASGEFTVINGRNMSHIARWNGTAWSAVGVGLSDDAEALIVYKSRLYAGGDFFMSGTDSCKNMAMWNDTIWQAVGGGMATSRMMVNMGMPSMVHSLAVCNGNLYAGGMFLYAGGMSCGNIAQWNGTSWSGIGTVGTGSMSDDITALCNYGGVLCIGGTFSSAGGKVMNNMGQYNGGKWIALDSGANNTVFAMTTCKGILYSGGSFTNAGGGPEAYISQLKKITGINNLSVTNSFPHIYPNPITGSTAYISLSGNSIPVSSELVLYNILGEKQMSISFSEMQKVGTDNYRFNLKNILPSGMYIYRVLNSNAVIGTGKVLIE